MFYGVFFVFQKTYQNNGYFGGDSGLVGTVVIFQFPFNWKKIRYEFSFFTNYM